MPILATNKKANFDYEILEKQEAGIELKGHEVKSVKQGSINLKGAFVSFYQNQAWLNNAHISKYKQAGNLKDYDPTRRRKLLLHRKQIKYLLGKSQEKGLTIIPLSVYTKDRLIKLEIGIGKGKKKYDKRETIKKRDIEREIARKIKN